MKKIQEFFKCDNEKRIKNAKMCEIVDVSMSDGSTTILWLWLCDAKARRRRQCCPLDGDWWIFKWMWIVMMMENISHQINFESKSLLIVPNLICRYLSTTCWDDDFFSLLYIHSLLKLKCFLIKIFIYKLIRYETKNFFITFFCYLFSL